MKKIAAIALAAVLSFGCAAPAFAAGPHHGAGRCFNYSGLCQGIAQNAIKPGLQSLNDRLGDMLAQASGTNAQTAGVGAGYGAQAGNQMTSPGLCANGACGVGFVDADGDGVCDYYGTNCPNPNGGNYVDADGDGVCDNYGSGYSNGNGIGRANGAVMGSGYGGHHGAGHHGGYRR